jgi:hypothetical protein
MAKERIAVAIATGKQLIRDEHAFFVRACVDDSEHVARIGRIAESVRCLLVQEGVGSSDADRAKRDLIAFGRALFVQEWMKPVEGDDGEPSEDEAVAVFDSILDRQTR